MSDKSLIKPPVSVGTGGMLYAILKGLTGSAKDLSAFTISPFIFILSLPCSLFAPMLWALLIFKSHCVKVKQDFSLKSFISQHIGMLLVFEAIYCICLFLLFNFLLFKIDSLTALYISQAQNLNTLQIGTALQADYARSITFLFAVCALIVLFLITFLSLSAYSLINKDSNIVKTALKALLLNLPGFIVLYAACVCVFIVVERSFAVFKLNAVQAMILNQDYFDWSFAFIALRVYLLCAFVNAIFVLGALIFKFLSMPNKNV